MCVWGGGGGENIMETLHSKIEILGHLYVSTLQKLHHSMEMGLLSLKG